MRTLTWEQVWARRLAKSGLLVPAPREGIVDAVRAVCGIHAQVMPAAELSAGIRIAGITRQDVRDALWRDRTLVKAHGPRGTVHLFPADELPLWTAALRANPTPSETRRLAHMGLAPDQMEAVIAAIGDALDGRCLTRDALGAEVARRAGSWATEPVSPAFGGHWPRWLMALGHASHAGLLCFGPNEGANVTFVRPDQWLGGWKAMDGAAARREVLRRYLATYGPATHHDFARWFGMAPGAAGALFRELALAGELELIDVEDHRAWLLAGEGESAASPRPARDLVRLLPHFDCYLIGCHPRDRLVPAGPPRRVLTRGSIGNVPAVVIGGIVAGLWQHKRSGRRLAVRVEVFQPLSDRQHQELEAAAARIGEIAEAKSSLTLGPVEAHPHL